MRVESSGKPDAWKLACPVWGWGRGETPRPTPHRYYQHFSGMFVAVAFTYSAWVVSNGKGLRAAGWANLHFVALEIVLFAASRNTLRLYYSRVAQLLGTLKTPKKGACRMANGIGKHHVKNDPASKPVVRKQAPAAKPNSPRAEQTRGR